MKRRDFLKLSAPLTLTPLLLNGLPIRALANSTFANQLAFTDTNHILVLIQLNGGNDGLNTVLPIDQYSNLAKARPNILIPENKGLKLNGFDSLKLHPSMKGMQNLFNDGKISIVQSVGYPNQDFSHFRSTDIWMSASDSNEIVESGWIGRYLQNEWPNFPNGFPNSEMPDPLAIQIGSVVAPVCQGSDYNMGMAISDPEAFYQLLTGQGGSVPNTKAGKELEYIRLVADQSNEYGKIIKRAAEKADNKSDLYPSNGNQLADQLKIIARLIAGGLKTRVYVASIGGFDTHATQADTTDPTQGNHANLLEKVSVGIEAFQDDLEKLGVSNRVLGMTFSEFGRRVASNFSEGTDHGAAAPMFLFGTNVKAGVVGNNPVIPDKVEVQTNVEMQNDFRSVYSTILNDWFCLPNNETDGVMLRNFDTLPLIADGVCNTSSAQRVQNKKMGDNLIVGYPNPFQTGISIDFESEGGSTQLYILDMQGKNVATLLDNETQKGKHTIKWNAEGQAAGTYICRYQNAQKVSTKLLIKAM